MKQTFTILFLFLFISSFANVTDSKMFDENLLNNPIKNRQQLEKLFDYNEIDIFNTRSFTNTVILENGYARSPIINKQDWERNVENRKVTQIDIIFTKYPFKKEDWITNYHKLLSARLNALFALDPSLNNKDIEWNLVLQTECETAQKAKNFFHGILIKFEIIKEKEPKEVSIPAKNINPRILKDIQIPLDTFENNQNKISFDENYTPDYNKTRNFKNPLKKKKKHKNRTLPECPTFDRKWFHL